MTQETFSKAPWRRSYTWASALLVVGLFTATAAGAMAGSTAQRTEPALVSPVSTVVTSDRSYILTEDGRVFGQGLNNYGQLGIGSTANSNAWTQVTFPGDSQPEIVKLDNEDENVIALDSAGGLWSWGGASAGAQTGGSRNTVVSPARLTVSYTFDEVAAGNSFVVAIDTRGALYAWGDNSAGQLGLGNSNPTTGPRMLPAAARFDSVTAGAYFALAVDTGGRLWGWGANGAGQLANGSKDALATPTMIGDKTWDSVHASRFSNTVVGIDSDGDLFTWGAAANALLGTGSDWRAEQAAENQRVQDEIARIQLEDQVAREFLVDETRRGVIDGLIAEWATARAAWLEENPEPVLSDFLTLPTTPAQRAAAEEEYDEALVDWQELQTAWALENPLPTYETQLSDEQNAAIEAQVEAEFEPTDTSQIVAAVIPEPELPQDATEPQAIQAPVEFLDASVGAENAYALDALGRLWAWGSDRNGQTALGLDEDTRTHLPLRVGTASYSSIYAGDRWAVASGSRSGLYTWGLNSEENVLLSDSPKLLAPTQVNNGSYGQVAGSASTGAAIGRDGATVSWGDNTSGVSGQKRDEAAVGLAPVEGGFKSLAFTETGVAAVAFSGGSLYSWGSDDAGVSALTKPREEAVNSPVRHSVDNFVDIAAGGLSGHALDANGFVWTWGLSWLGQAAKTAASIETPLIVEVGEPVKSLASSATDVVLVTESDRVLFWGARSRDFNPEEIGGAEQAGKITSVKAGSDHFLLLNEAGEVWSYTPWSSLATPEGSTPKNFARVELPFAASSISAGGASSTAIDGNVAYGWGDNSAGQLIPSEGAKVISAPTELPNAPAEEWATLATSATHTVGLTTSGLIFVWGDSRYIQGLGAASVAAPVQSFLEEN